jgi:sphingolipid delta-4 desaturase
MQPTPAFGAGPRDLKPVTTQAVRHLEMRREILQAHPEVRHLFGADGRGVPAALLILGIHWTMLWAVAQTNVLMVFVAALLVGQITIHAAGALVHESAHRLVVRPAEGKLFFDLLLEVITTSFARQLTYQHEHVTSHHPHLGNYERDYEHEDVCRFTARRRHRADHPLVQRFLTVAELVVHLLPGGFLVADRLFLPYYRRASGQAVSDGQRAIGASRATRSERALFIGVSLAINVFLCAAFGFLGWLYHVWSLSLFLGKCGVTNLGQSLAEHPGDDSANPTRSTYWWGNRLLFNTGYHNEHHTFPNVAWTRLPALKALAPEVFDRVKGRSYFTSWWNHVRQDFSPSRQNPVMASDLSARCHSPRP